MARTAGAICASALLILVVLTYGMKVRATPLPLPIIPALTIIFITSGSVIVTYIAARAYMKEGLPSVLFVGSGSLVFGSTSLLAALMAGETGSNAATTVFIVGALASSVLHLCCAASRFLPVPVRKGSGTVTASGITLSLVMVGVITAAAIHGAIPRFLTPGVGTTLVAKVSLGAAIASFGLASLIIGVSSRSAILYWYSWALAVTAIGLVGIFLSDWVFEAVVFWVGRIALCVGGVFLVLSVVAAERGEPSQDPRRGERGLSRKRRWILIGNRPNETTWLYTRGPPC